MGERCYGRHGRCYVLNIRWNLDQLRSYTILMTVMLDAFLIINALPPKFLQKRFPLLFPWCISSIVYME